jgi:single-stranded-DNA-specific exonuclease
VAEHAPLDAGREFSLAPFSYSRAREIARALDLTEPVAVALVRRGHDTVAAARAFLAADEAHDAAEFAGIDRAVAAIRAAIDRDDLITVHGDYDVDGVTATTILVGTLRDLGARCDWLIPDRLADGYGLTAATLKRLAARGTGLLLTADCGITSVEAVAAARELGIAVVVTDHHQPGDALPDCPIVHPLVGAYPCPDLCAAGVAHKLAVALAGAERAERDLDLVALATVADMVPLVGENRTLVRRGIATARRARRPGLRALMAVASIVPERLAEGDLGFRLAPRINAAGRLYRADAAVELFLTEDGGRAARIADELDRANHERRRTEAEVLADAERRLRELEKDGEAGPAIVLWGEGWHPGVVGICASRMAERHLRPAILIALDEHGRGKGSGRSVPGFDLLAGLRACARSLARFGGHRAAAGLEIERSALERFRAEFAAHAAAHLDLSAAAPREAIDAVVGGESLGHDVAAQLARLGPFGKGNPEVRLLVPSARLEDVRGMGEEERHSRFSLHSGPARVAGVAFGVNGALATAAEAGPADVSVALELNEWNGAVAPRVVLSRVYASPAAGPTGSWGAGADEFARRLDAAIAGPSPVDAPVAIAPAREAVDRAGAAGVAAVAALASSAEPVLVVGADALWRRGLVDGAVPPWRFGGGESALIAARGSLETGAAAAKRVLASERGGIALADWPALGLLPELARAFPHVVLADPAPSADLHAIAAAGEGYLHVLASHSDPDLSRRALELRFPLRSGLGEAFRNLRATAAGRAELELETVRAALCGPDGDSRSAEWCALTLLVLAEIGVVRMRGSGRERVLEVVSSVRGELARSRAYAAQVAAHEECKRFLTQGKEPSSRPLPAAA